MYTRHASIPFAELFQIFDEASDTDAVRTAEEAQFPSLPFARLVHLAPQPGGQEVNPVPWDNTRLKPLSPQARAPLIRRAMPIADGMQRTSNWRLEGERGKGAKEGDG